MNEIYTDLEKRPNPIQRVVEFVVQQFNLPYGDSVNITVKLPRYRIMELSRRMLAEAKEAGMLIPTAEDFNKEEMCFTKYTLPCGTIEFIDNGE